MAITNHNLATPQNRLNQESIRADFPLLQRKINANPLIYLDNAATTQKPQQVMSAIQTCLTQYNANIHRGIHSLAEEATEAYEGVRKQIKRFFDVPNDFEVIFTKHTTEALNLLAYGWHRQQQEHQQEPNQKPQSQQKKGRGAKTINEKNGVATSIVEHHANFVPWQMLAQQQHTPFYVFPSTPTGAIDWEQFEQHEAHYSQDVGLVAMTMVSNVTGQKTPYKTIMRSAKTWGARRVLDAAQAAPHRLLDDVWQDTDAVAFSAHKMLGPTGVGVLIGRKAFLQELEPLLYGGHMIASVSTSTTTYAPLPERFEAGTAALADVVGYGAALKYLQTLGKQRLHKITNEQIKTFYESIEDHHLQPIQISEKKKDQVAAVFSFHDPRAHPHDLASLLDAQGIAVRAGHHCAMPFMQLRNIPGTLRASAYVYNTPDEIERFAKAYAKARMLFS